MTLSKILDKVTKAQMLMNFPCINLQASTAALPPMCSFHYVIQGWYTEPNLSPNHHSIINFSTSSPSHHYRQWLM